jgi:hypothetical protein
MAGANHHDVAADHYGWHGQHAVDDQGQHAGAA